MVREQKNKKMASVVFHVFSCLLGFIMIYPLLLAGGELIQIQ